VVEIRSESLKERPEPLILEAPPAVDQTRWVEFTLIRENIPLETVQVTITNNFPSAVMRASKNKNSLLIGLPGLKAEQITALSTAQGSLSAIGEAHLINLPLPSARLPTPEIPRNKIGDLVIENWIPSIVQVRIDDITISTLPENGTLILRSVSAGTYSVTLQQADGSLSTRRIASRSNN
jgi:hypothetical protein